MVASGQGLAPKGRRPHEDWCVALFGHFFFSGPTQTKSNLADCLFGMLYLTVVFAISRAVTGNINGSAISRTGAL